MSGLEQYNASKFYFGLLCQISIVTCATLSVNKKKHSDIREWGTAGVNWQFEITEKLFKKYFTD